MSEERPAINSSGEVECPVCRRDEVGIIRVQKSLRGRLILTYRCPKRHEFDVTIAEDVDCDIRVWANR